MTVDTVISLNHIITLASAFAMLVWFVAKLQTAVLQLGTSVKVLIDRMGQFDEAMVAVNARLDKLTESVDRISQIMATAARQDERINSLVQANEETRRQIIERFALIDGRMAAFDILVSPKGIVKRKP